MELFLSDVLLLVYRNAIEFCYVDAVSYNFIEFIYFTIFWGGIIYIRSGFLKIGKLYFFLFILDAFFLFFCGIALLRILALSLVRVVSVGTLILFPVIKEKL